MKISEEALRSTFKGAFGLLALNLIGVGFTVYHYNHYNQYNPLPILGYLFVYVVGYGIGLITMLPGSFTRIIARCFEVESNTVKLVLSFAFFAVYAFGIISLSSLSEKLFNEMGAMIAVGALWAAFNQAKVFKDNL
ncbi:hypothetical protein [Enterobacter cloacae]|uniref:hypothetical protein n=1 Tax=Enterobacter cloacae TaxID=550 RepID=UPI003F4537FE